MAARRQAGRFYDVNGVQLPSVTTILGAINKPALVNWASYGARDATRAVARSIYATTHPEGLCLGLTPASFEAALAKTQGNRPAHLAKSDEALGIGTLVHARIEAEMKNELGGRVKVPEIPEQEVIDGRAVPHPAWNSYQSYLAWRKAHEVKPVAIEQRVYTTRLGFAGTADLVAYVDDVLTLADFKTSKGVYGEYRLQIAAYRAAVLDMEPDVRPPLGGLVLRFPKEVDDDFEAHVVPWEEQDALLEVFMAAKRIWQWQQEDAR